MTTTAPPPAVTTARDGFPQLVRAEWTKFRSVRGTRWSAIAIVVLTVGLSLFGASAFSTSTECPCAIDQGHFVHQPLPGDGTVTARVATQQDTGTSPRAGIMIKEGLEYGTPYASIGIVPGQGVRMQANYGADIAGSPAAAPVWLRLTRGGGAITGYESADGAAWTLVGTVDASRWRPEAEAGLFVTSPGREKTIRITGGSSRGYVYPLSTATFDSVSVAGPTGPISGTWQDEDRNGPVQNVDGTVVPGSASQAAGVFTVTGAGDIKTEQPSGNDDVVRNSLAGVLFGLMAAAALGVIFVTAEYSRGTIRTTFAASPRRGRVLAAKAVIVGAVTFLCGLVGAVTAFLLAQPLLHGNGYRPPAYPYVSLADWPVLRAVAGTAAFLALLALLGLGLGTIMRRAAGAIALIIAPAVVPLVLAPLLPLTPGIWLQRLTPSAGLAIQETRQRFDSPIDPWAGLGVLAAYAVVALGIAFWQLRRRDA